MARVLYVEDEALLALATADSLEEGGFEVVVARDGAEAVERSESFEPDLIVTDYMMPNMAGDAMLRILRGQGVTAPAILTTALSRQELPTGVLSMFDDYVEKPFGDADLIARMRMALSRVR